jgi:hypothetical protein
MMVPWTYINEVKHIFKDFQTNDNGYINKKQTQLEEDDEPLTLMRWSCCTALIITLASYC